MYKAGLEKAKEPKIKLPTSVKSQKKQGGSKKPIYFCFFDYTLVFDCVDHNELWKILKGGRQTTLPSSWETCMQVKKQQLEPDMEQRIGSKLGKEYIRLYPITVLI